jgi:hypothetical protein
VGISFNKGFPVKVLSLMFMLPMLFSMVSCEEKVAIGDKLSESERAYLRARASKKCLEESESTYKNLINLTLSNLKNAQRGQTYKLEYLKDNTVLDTFQVYVWKVTASDVYYRIKMMEGMNLVNKFLKISLAHNSDMLRGLQSKNCDKKLTVAGSSTLSAIPPEAPRILTDTDEWSRYTNTYAFSPVFPVYLGMLNKIQKQEISTTQTGAFTKTISYEYRLSTTATTTTLPAAYNDASIVNPQYCMPKFTAGTPTTYSFPFDLKCEQTDVAVDANGDSTPDFAPYAEL